MAVRIAPDVRLQFFDNQGRVLNGGKLFTYLAGTSTKQATYTDYAGGTQNANPIVLDSAGRTPAGLWLSDGVAYKLVLAPANDTDPPGSPIWSEDQVSGTVSNSDLANTANVALGDALVGFRQSNAAGLLTGAVASTVHKKLQEFLSVRDFGAIGDGNTDDTAAIVAAMAAAYAEDKALYVPGGEYKITDHLDFTAYFGVKMFGDGPNASPAFANASSRIIQYTNNKAILKLWGPCIVHGLYLAYNSQQTTAQTASYGVELNNISLSSFKDIKVQRANTSFGIPQVDFKSTGFNAIFATIFENLQSYEASECHLDFRSYQGGSTNCAVINPYLNGGGTADFVTVGQTCNHAIRGSNWKGWHWDTMSIDGMTINDVPIDVDGNSKWTVGYIRFEGDKVTANTAVWLENAGSHASLLLGSLELDNCRWVPSVATSMYVLFPNAANSVLKVGNVYFDTDCDFGVSGTRRVLLNGATDSATGYQSLIEIGPISDQGSKLGDRIWTENAISTALTPVQVWDGMRVNWRQKAGRSGSSHRVVVDTAVPSTGTYVAGDECIILAPVIGRATRYKCTTGGTPGTWRQMSQTVKIDTTANRVVPVASDIGLMYMDTTLDADGKPIWWNGTAWVDATGALV